MSEGAFLAEASVLIQANTKLFRDELAAALLTVPKAIEIPIVAVAQTGTANAAAATLAKTAAAAQASGAAAQAGATGVTAASQAVASSAKQAQAGTLGLAAALQQQGAAARLAGVSTQQMTAAQTQALSINRSFAAVEKALAVAELQVVGAATAEQKAHIQNERAASAGAAARDLLTEAELAGINTEKLLANQTIKSALAYGEQAAAAEASAAAQRASAVASGEAAKGLQAQALSSVGLRGAIIGANPAFLAATAGAIAFGAAIKEATGFQTQLNTFRVVAGATADEMTKVGDAATQLGKDVTLPGVSASDAAQSFTELSKAGLSVQDSLDGARGVLQLATAAGIDNAQATELAASALNSFGLAGDQAVHVADVLANAANDAQGSITDIGIALQQASAAGRQAGLSLEQTTAILTEFAKNGIKGSDAGTLLRTLLIRLINPTTKAAKVIKELGLNVRDASGAIDVHVFQQFEEATKNLTPAARDAAAAIIGGQDAFRGISILARVGGDALDDEVKSLNTTGTAAAVAGAKMSGLAGDASALQSNLQTLGITLGTVLIPVLGSIVSGANIVTTGFQKAADAVKAFNSAISGGTFDPANANLDELAGHLADLQKEADDFKKSTSSGFVPPSFAADQAGIAKQITDIGKALNTTPAGFQKFVRIVSAASPQIKAAFEDNIITPAEKAALQSTALGRAFVAALPKSAFAGLGAAIRSGLEDATAAARVGVADTGAEIHSGIEDASRSAVVDAHNLGTNVAKAFTDGFAGAARAARLAAGAAASNIIDIQFKGGSPQQQLSALNKQLQAQTDLVDVLTKRGAPQAKIDQAKQDAIATQGQIDSVQSTIDAAQQATISKAKAASAKRVQEAQAAQQQIAKDDQKVLDSFVPAQNRIDLATISANASDRLSDNLKLQNLIIAEANREVKIITDTVKDVKTKNAALAQQAQVIKAAEVERDSIIKQIAQTATANRQAAANALTESLGKAITLADLRENDKAEIAAINKAIANARFRIRNYKKLGLNLQDEKIALEQLINDRQAVNDKKKDAEKTAQAGRGTTAFDLLKEAAATFNQSAGNLIGGNQPFAGPTGFTADIAQFLIRRQGPATSPSTAKADFTAPLVSSNAELITVIRENTQAIRDSSGGANSSTAGPVVHGTKQSRVWHSENLMARRYQEA